MQRLEKNLREHLMPQKFVFNLKLYKFDMLAKSQDSPLRNFKFRSALPPPFWNKSKFSASWAQGRSDHHGP